MSQPFDEMDAVLLAAAGLGVDVLEAMLSNKLPVGEVTFDAAGGDCGAPNPVSPAKASACGFGGGGDTDDEFVGNVRPLKASVKEPTFD